MTTEARPRQLKRVYTSQAQFEHDRRKRWRDGWAVLDYQVIEIEDMSKALFRHGPMGLAGFVLAALLWCLLGLIRLVFRKTAGPGEEWHVNYVRVDG